MNNSTEPKKGKWWQKTVDTKTGKQYSANGKEVKSPIEGIVIGALLLLVSFFIGPFALLTGPIAFMFLLRAVKMPGWVGNLALILAVGLAGTFLVITGLNLLDSEDDNTSQAAVEQTSLSIVSSGTLQVLLNRERSKVGLAPLGANEKACTSAKDFAKSIVNRGSTEGELSAEDYDMPEYLFAQPFVYSSAQSEEQIISTFYKRDSDHYTVLTDPNVNTMCSFAENNIYLDGVEGSNLIVTWFAEV